MTDRRRFLLTAAAGLAAPAILPRRAQADMACYQFDGRGQPCEVGVRIDQFIPAQECQYWCWAACAETIFLLNGYQVPQRDLAQKVFGNPDACMTATGEMIAHAVRGNWTDRRGRSFRAGLEVVIDAEWGIWHPDPVNLAWAELREGRPLIIGTLGHAMVLTAMSYYQHPAGWELTGLTVRDPWPESPGRRQLRVDEFYATQFLATVRVG